MIDLAHLDEREDVLHKFTSEIAELVDAVRVSVTLRDSDDPDQAVVVSLYGTSDKLAVGSTVALEGTTIGAAIRDNRMVYRNTQEGVDQRPEAVHSVGILHVVSAPISVGHRVHGSVNAGYSTLQPAPDDLSVLQRLAGLLASQLERIDLQDNLRHELEAGGQRTGRLMNLYGLESRLSLATNLNQVLGELAPFINDLAPVSRVSYAQRGPAAGTATVFAISGDGVTSNVVPLDEHQFDRTWAGHAYQYNPDHRSSSHEQFHDTLAEMGILSSLNLGVYVDNSPVGTLNVGCNSVDGLTADDRALLATVASFLGSTLERIASHDQLVYQAHHDVLTGLLRRERFEEELATEIDRLRQRDETSAVCFLDLDRFKLVNDTEGHQVGDRLLRNVSDQLRACLRPHDVAARLGGDEFVLLLRHREAHEYETICAELLLSTAGAGFIADHSVIAPSASIGWVTVDAAAAGPHEVLAAADAACYVAKRRGGGTAIQASSSDDAQNARRNAGQILNEVKDALQHNRFTLLGQPIRQLSAEGPNGFEVLLRMHDHAGDLIQPDIFIPAAERYGLIADIDLWVLHGTLSALERNHRSGTNPAPSIVFVNVSANSIVKDGFVDQVSTLLKETCIDPAGLCFEVTESGTMRNVDAALRFINRVRSIGSSVALDDFGVGFSSLGRLRHLPIDHLKIDGSLIREIDTNPVDAAMVTAVQTLAAAIGITTIAEHIETESALEAITALGVDSGQGYFLGHPAPIERLLGIGPPEHASQQIPTASSWLATAEH